MDQLVWYYPQGHEAHAEYGHPERPERVETIVAAMQDAGWWDPYPQVEPYALDREILESVQLEADLVVLSACETGLGREMGGEGMMGLTRAFLYAGARSVMTSLWPVSDVSTAELMGEFYSGLKEGETADGAIQYAQKKFICFDRYSHPFFWAGFTITSD